MEVGVGSETPGRDRPDGRRTTVSRGRARLVVLLVLVAVVVIVFGYLLAVGNL